MKTASGSILAAGLVVVFVLVYSRSLFFKLAIVPLLPHEFTLSGYTQFSPSHLGDIVSQLLMLVPGLLVFAGSWAAFRAQTPMPGRSQVFLVLAALSALGSLVMLDPKLGMPRDWDLFAFAGVPIAVLTYISLLLRHRYRIALFMIALGFGLLLPRVVSQSIPDIALAHVANYMELDVYRNRMLHGTLVDYFEAQGNRAAADSVTSLWNRRFPERNEITRAMQLLDRGNYEEAISVSRYILRRNPQYSDAWSNLGVAMEYLGHYDSAVTYYRISNALNPYNPILLDNWATVYIAKRQFDKARQLLNRAENIDSTLSRIHFHRAEIAKAEKNIPDYLFHANRAISQSDALPTYFLDLGVSYLQLNQSDKAIEIFRRGVTRGLSPHTVDSLLQRYSQ